MPTVPRSPSTLIHSWSLVYLSPAGYAISSPGRRSSGTRPLVKGHRHDLRTSATAANVHVKFCPNRGVSARQVRHADRLLQIRRLRAARHHAHPGVAEIRVVSLPGDAAIDHLEAHEFPRNTFGFLLAQRLGADEIGLLPADDPSEIGLERGRRLIDVVAMEPHRRFETQRVSRAQAARQQLDGLSSLQYRQPDPIG